MLAQLVSGRVGAGLVRSATVPVPPGSGPVGAVRMGDAPSLPLVWKDLSNRDLFSGLCRLFFVREGVHYGGKLSLLLASR